MPPLDWLAFTQLSGGATRNWELLCRELVRRSYGRYGLMRSVAQQPGVEFHLELHTSCDLGDGGRWWGWQCRWYEIPAGTQLGTRRREKILDAIRTSERVLPSLTDWVLWTVRPLTPTDQEWFEAIDTPLRLVQWTGDHVEGLLTGDAAVLRETYFGELILNSARLERIHELAVAPLKKRWDPAVHVEVHVEEELNRVLGDSDSWPELGEAVAQLALRSAELAAELADLHSDVREIAQSLATDLADLHERASTVAEALAAGRLADARGAADRAHSPLADPAEVRQAARRCRARSNPSSLTLTAGLGEVERGSKLLDRIRRYLSLSLVAVVGDAGRGKTHLAAQLTARSRSRTAGCVIRGRDLAARGTLDDLARRVLGVEAGSFERLVAALDAAGARTGGRLPLVIDGLNEAENPRDWHDLLAPLPRLLEDYPHVVVVVTLRSSVVADALPADTPSVSLPGFLGVERNAAARYLEHYKIDSGMAPLPIDLFAHPLFLRLFCEATNPTRAEWVGVEAIPASLDAVFAAYRDVAVDRVAADLRQRPEDVRGALEAIATELWRRRSRALPFEDLRAVVGDPGRDWVHSFARAFEEEGILLRDGGADDQQSELLFDAFAGFMIAEALTLEYGSDLSSYLATGDAVALLSPDVAEPHPLARDILAGLGGVMPRMIGQQLWRSVEGEARLESLRVASELPAELLDAETVEELMALVAQPPRRVHVLDRLRAVRAASAHPLNSEFLDRALRALSVADRDLSWTEWVRARERTILDDLGAQEALWRAGDRTDDQSDALTALWVSWLLTSTVRPLRDQATRALFQYGRANPPGLFSLTLRQLDVNDPYVPERLLAACYGVVMANQTSGSDFGDELGELLDGLERRLGGADGLPMPHWLSRQYLQGLYEAAWTLWRIGSPDGGSELGLKGDLPPTPIAAERRSDHEVGGAFRMDFENYTVGGLVRGRQNYDFDDAEYKEVLASIRGRVWELGWREDAFRDLDMSVARASGGSSERGHKTERYGKKYGWIAFFEEAGRRAAARRHDAGALGSAWVSDVDIDPSFPASAPVAPIRLAPWATAVPSRDEDWIVSGSVDVPDRLLRPALLGEQEEPWLLAYGFLLDRNEDVGREVFAFIRTLLVPEQFTESVVGKLSDRGYLGNDYIPREPASYYTYAGEIPWSSRFTRDLISVDGDPLYLQRLQDGAEDEPEVEILSHGFAWESYHSALNQAGNVSVPSAAFSRHFGLRELPQGFNQVESDGTPAALVFEAPEGFEGHLLYLRESLVREYAAASASQIVVVAWGERVLTRGGYEDPPEWLRQAYTDHSILWRRVALLEELMG